MSLLQDSGFGGFDADGILEQFVIEAPTVAVSVDGQTVKEIFERQSEAEGVVVMENGEAAGIIMRTAFYQKMGTLYGHSLYMKRPVGILMDTEIMRIDAGDNIAKVGIQAMSREQSKLYDYLVVYKNKAYLGVVSIRLFLLELSKRNEAQISVLKNQQQKLISAHEKEVVLRKDLEYQSASVQNLLDHADQGFLWFGGDLTVKKEYSYKCLDIFHQSIGGVCYLDLVDKYFDEKKASLFRTAFDSYFKNNSSVTDHVYLMLLPSDCVIGGKNIHFEYRPIESGGEKAVMAVLTDITEKVALERAMEEDRNKQRLIIKAFSCQGQIRRMIDEFFEIFSGGYKNFFQEGTDFGESLHELFRAVHTFKGDFAQYGFVSAADKLHWFEEELFSLSHRSGGAGLLDVEAIMAKTNPAKMLENDLKVIQEVLGGSYLEQSETVSVPKSRLAEIQERLRDGEGPVDRLEAEGLIQSLKLKNIKPFLSQYRDYLQYLAGRVMKNPPVFLVEGDDVPIDPDLYGGFIKSLVHIFRNSMDHGIEADEERLEQGKPEKGLIACQISRLDGEWFTVSIADDGRGLDLAKLKDKAAQNGLYIPDELDRMTKDELCHLIFADRLSTKGSADTLSGRGVGMPALREACLKLGGKIEVETENKKGTTVRMTLPCLGAQTGEALWK